MTKHLISRQANKTTKSLLKLAIAFEKTTSNKTKFVTRMQAGKVRKRLNSLNQVTKDFKSGIKTKN